MGHVPRDGAQRGPGLASLSGNRAVRHRRQAGGFRRADAARRRGDREPAGRRARGAVMSGRRRVERGRGADAKVPSRDVGRIRGCIFGVADASSGYAVRC